MLRNCFLLLLFRRKIYQKVTLLFYKLLNNLALAAAKREFLVNV
ncbi:MAG TPA: hypothetical protein PKH93_05115 [Chitinophagales bacterium]|nr:hypothetical protein [Chitinophagales bacterium]